MVHYGVLMKCLLRKRGRSWAALISLEAELISRPEHFRQELKLISCVFPKPYTFNIICSTYCQFLCEKYVLFRNVSGFSRSECWRYRLERKRTAWSGEEYVWILNKIALIEETYTDNVSNGVLWFIHCKEVLRLRLTLHYVLHDPSEGKNNRYLRWISLSRNNTVY